MTLCHVKLDNSIKLYLVCLSQSRRNLTYPSHTQLCTKSGEGVGDPQDSAVPKGQSQGAVTDPELDATSRGCIYLKPERYNPLVQQPGTSAFNIQTQPIHGDSVGRKLGRLPTQLYSLLPFNLLLTITMV